MTEDKSAEKGLRRIGDIAVDAGIIMLGDPGYTLPDNGSNRHQVGGGDWDKFCELLDDEFHQEGFKQIGDFTAVLVSSGYGDGIYPVYASFDEAGRVTEVRVVFIDEERRTRMNALFRK